MDFSTLCPHCGNLQEYVLDFFQEYPCSACKKNLFPNASDAFKESFQFNQCPHCGAAHLYRHKDFNRKLGIGLLVIGILLSFWTYGLSLLLVTLVDWWLYKKVKDVGCCYLCHSQFRNGNQVEALSSFDLELYDYYRNLKR